MLADWRLAGCLSCWLPLNASCAAAASAAAAGRLAANSRATHCPAPLQTRDRFGWVWYNVTNFEPYLREVGYAGAPPRCCCCCCRCRCCRCCRRRCCCRRCRCCCRRCCCRCHCCCCRCCRCCRCCPMRLLLCRLLSLHCRRNRAHVCLRLQPFPPCWWAAASSAASRAPRWCWPA